MSRSDWGILTALAGLAALVVAFGSGLYLASLNYPHEQRYQPYRYSAEQPLQVEAAAATKANAQPLQYRTPCSQPEGQSESVLCAQWRAANAAEDGAFWTKWGVWIGIIGSSLLLWQIILTRQAVEDTSKATEAMREANEIAGRDEHNSRMSLRPWFSPVGLRWKFMIYDGVTYLEIRIIWKNHGSTPTRNLIFMETPFWGANTLQLEQIQTNFSPDSVRSIVGPGQEIWSQPTRLTLTEIDSIFSGTGRLFIYGFAKYQDLFGNDEHVTGHLWEIGINRHTDRPLEGDNVQEVTWTVAGKVNHAT